jgi:hypothetical protein
MDRRRFLERAPVSHWAAHDRGDYCHPNRSESVRAGQLNTTGVPSTYSVFASSSMSAILGKDAVKSKTCGENSWLTVPVIGIDQLSVIHRSFAVSYLGANYQKQHRTGTSRVSPEMALRLSKALGRTPESWLAMQDAHDLWQARKHLDLRRVSRLKLASA